MREIVDDRLLFQDALREVRGMRQWVLDAEHILSADFVGDRSGVSNLMVAQRFDSWLNTYIDDTGGKIAILLGIKKTTSRELPLAPDTSTRLREG